MTTEDRAVEDYASGIAGLRAEFEDRIATVTARQYQRPTGDVELAFRGTPKSGTLFLQGQTLNRADYPGLWAWAQASGSVVAGGYGAGNGTTTFTLPDMRDKFVVGAGGAITLGGTGGAATRTLTTANMPAHDHNVNGSAGSAGNHSHSGSTNSAGTHGGHIYTSGVVQGGTTAPAAHASFNNDGNHSHSVNINDAGSHSHSLDINESSVGSGTSFDTRPPWLGWNLAVWT